MNLLNNPYIEKLNEEIKLFKRVLDFVINLEDNIKNGASGYDLAYKMEQNEDLISCENSLNIHIDMYFGVFMLAEIGGDNLLDDKNGGYIIDHLKKFKNDLQKGIGYLEFKKSRPKPTKIKEKIQYGKDLDDFISFLDDKFKEWEKRNSGKKY